MPDERVAELMKQSVARKEPRDGCEQRVLAVAISRRQKAPLWLVWLIAAPIVVCGLGYYGWSSHEAEKKGLIQQKQAAERAQQLAEQQAQELQKQIAAIEREQSDLEARLVRAKTEAQRDAIQRQMEANKARARTLREGPAIKIGGGDSTDPLQGIK